MNFSEAFQIFADAIKTAKNTFGKDKVNWFDQQCKSHYGPTARGSRFYEDPKETLDSVILDLRNEFSFQDNDGILLATVKCREDIGVEGALSIDHLPVGGKVKVEALGHHPTLVCIDSCGVMLKPSSTKIVTFIVEHSGPEYENDVKELGWPEGLPILATFFPGQPLPPSRPHDCEVGDILTVNEAAEKGWKVVKAI